MNSKPSECTHNYHQNKEHPHDYFSPNDCNWQMWNGTRVAETVIVKLGPLRTLNQGDSSLLLDKEKQDGRSQTKFFASLNKFSVNMCSSVRLRIHISQNPNLLLVTRVSVGVMKYLIDIPVQRVPQNWTMNLIFYVLVLNESPVGTSSIPWRVRIPVYNSFKCRDTVGRNRQPLEATSEAPSDKRLSLGGWGGSLSFCSYCTREFGLMFFGSIR